MIRPDALGKAAIEWAAATPPSYAIGSRARILREAIEAKFPGAIERQKARDTKAAFERKFIGPVPDWAKRYVAKYGPRVSTLTIRQSRTRRTTSGRCYSGSRLVVTFGYKVRLHGNESPAAQASITEEHARQENDYRIVVLHEIAHTLAPYDSHGDDFYRHWRKLLVAEGLLRDAEKRWGRSAPGNSGRPQPGRRSTTTARSRSGRSCGSEKGALQVPQRCRTMAAPVAARRLAQFPPTIRQERREASGVRPNRAGSAGCLESAAGQRAEHDGEIGSGGHEPKNRSARGQTCGHDGRHRGRRRW